MSTCNQLDLQTQDLNRLYPVISPTTAPVIPYLQLELAVGSPPAFGLFFCLFFCFRIFVGLEGSVMTTSDVNSGDIIGVLEGGLYYWHSGANIQNFSI